MAPWKVRKSPWMNTHYSFASWFIDNKPLVGLSFSPVWSTTLFFFWPVLTTLKWDHCSQCTAVKLLIPCADMSCIGCAIVPASQCPFGSKSVENKMKKIKNKRWLDVLAEALRSAYTNINTWDAEGERAWLYWYTGKNAGLYFKCGK